MRASTRIAAATDAMRSIPAFVSCIALAMAFAAAAVATAREAVAQDGAKPATPRTIRIFRCTDAAGRVTLQNDVPCPKGTRQQQQVVEAPPPVPAYVPRVERMPALVAAERADEASDIAAAAKAAASPDAAPAAATGANPPMPPAPPPQLYACRTWDERELLTEDATPAERCAPLQVVAADGSTRSDAAACEKVTDQCEAVPADALCTAWQRRVDEAEFRWRFAGAKQDDDRRREYELLKAKLAQSDCAP
jgi:hypothetical protein